MTLQEFYRRTVDVVRETASKVVSKVSDAYKSPSELYKNIKNEFTKGAFALGLAGLALLGPGYKGKSEGAMLAPDLRPTWYVINPNGTVDLNYAVFFYEEDPWGFYILSPKTTAKIVDISYYSDENFPLAGDPILQDDGSVKLFIWRQPGESKLELTLTVDKYAKKEDGSPQLEIYGMDFFYELGENTYHLNTAPYVKGCDNCEDDNISPVPEPRTGLLFLVGLGGLLFWRRKNKN